MSSKREAKNALASKRAVEGASPTVYVCYPQIPFAYGEGYLTNKNNLIFPYTQNHISCVILSVAELLRGEQKAER